MEFDVYKIGEMTVAELVEEQKQIAEATEELRDHDRHVSNVISRKVKQLHDAGKSIEEIYEESNLPFKDLAIFLGHRRFEEATGYEHASDHPDWDTAI